MATKRYSVKALQEQWDRYKKKCDSKRKPVYGFSPQKLEFVEANVRSPVSYDVKGFCVFLGLSEQAFYKSYFHDEKYSELMQRIKLECEDSKREGFEQGTIPSQLAGIWMARYDGYGEKETGSGETEQDDPLTAALKEEAERLAHQ